MNVLFLNHCLSYGGATKSLILMEMSLNKDIQIFTAIKKQKKIIPEIRNEFKFTKEFVEFEIPLIYSHSDGTIQNKDFEKNINFFPNSLINYINNKKIDILHINSTLFPHILKPIKENTNCKIVVHIREMLPDGRRNKVDNFMINNFIQFADAIIAITDNEIRHFDYCEKIHIIPNPHNFSETDKYNTIANDLNSKLIIGMCSAFLEIKGHIDFLKTAKIINEVYNNSKTLIEFRIIGYPIYVNSLKEIIKKIIHFGYKSQFDRIVKLLKLNNIIIIPYTLDTYKDMSKFDIFVRPDLTGNPWGRDIIEAMAMRKPIVATGTSEFFVKNGETGFLVPVNDPYKMAEKIILLINNTELRIKMGTKSYEIIKNKCDLNLYSEKILNIYKKILTF